MKNATKQIIVILGMHRSGTSCLTGCLQQLGLNLGKVSEYNEYNLKGNREDDKIAILNENIMQTNGGSWRNPISVSKWSEEHIKRRDKILEEYFQLPSPIGIKDPRMLFTYQFWNETMMDLDFVGSFRHPMSVAQSLYARKNMRIEISQGLKLWCSYNSQLLLLQKQLGFNLVNFDLEANQYLNQVIKAAKKLNLNHEIKLIEFFDNNLRNQNIADIEIKNCTDEALEIYNQLLSISIDNTQTPTYKSHSKLDV
ncbi:MAG: hypothetical protein AB8B80_16225 [Marinicellaceae bacterium]